MASLEGQQASDWQQALGCAFTDILLDKNGNLPPVRIELDRNFKLQYQTSLYAQFTCSNKACLNKWSSYKSGILFVYGFVSRKEGFEISIKQFGQSCKKCQRDEYEKPRYPVDAMNSPSERLVKKIGVKFYGLDLNGQGNQKVGDGEGDDLDGGRGGPPHDSEHCEACKEGFCQVARRSVQGNSAPENARRRPPTSRPVVNQRRVMENKDWFLKMGEDRHLVSKLQSKSQSSENQRPQRASESSTNCRSTSQSSENLQQRANLRNRVEVGLATTLAQTPATTLAQTPATTLAQTPATTLAQTPATSLPSVAGRVTSGVQSRGSYANVTSSSSICVRPNEPRGQRVIWNNGYSGGTEYEFPDLSSRRPKWEESGPQDSHRRQSDGTVTLSPPGSSENLCSQGSSGGSVVRRNTRDLHDRRCGDSEGSAQTPIPMNKQQGRRFDSSTNLTPGDRIFIVSLLLGSLIFLYILILEDGANKT